MSSSSNIPIYVKYCKNAIKNPKRKSTKIAILNFFKEKIFSRKYCTDLKIPILPKKFTTRIFVLKQWLWKIYSPIVLKETRLYWVSSTGFPKIIKLKTIRYKVLLKLTIYAT